jgi:cytochrome b involved in lipid metabolism
MMRKVFIASTLLFWLAVIGFGLADSGLPAARNAAPAPAAAQRYALQEVARHGRQDDCWMAIGGAVYDFTAYLPQHPSAPALMLPWCGKDATQAFRTKTKNRPHSSYAEHLLAHYRIGELIPAQP